MCYVKDFHAILFCVINLFLISVEGVKWRFGGCVVELYEPCPADGAVQFYAMSSDFPNEKPIHLDPHHPIFPSNYNLSAPVKIVIHGYGGGKFDISSPEITKAYLNAPGLNVIVVDWLVLSAFPCYPASVINTWQAGRCTAVLLSSLTAMGIPAESIHIIGFSLGAHIAGIASNHMQSAVGTVIGRITGLDPALPLYATLSLRNEWKLDSTDASFVDIIHTNAGLFGKIESTGHVDFYVNGGSAQPPCENDPTPRLCSHLMAPIYFAESVKSEKGFWGISCPSYIQYLLGWCPETVYRKHQRILMGEKCSKKSRGVYFVVTNNEEPFALG